MQCNTHLYLLIQLAPPIGPSAVLAAPTQGCSEFLLLSCGSAGMPCWREALAVEAINEVMGFTIAQVKPV